MERSESTGDFGVFASGMNPLEGVREGMRVVDSAGEEIGDVEIVKMGDPNAATIGADADRGGGLMRDFAEAFGWDAEPDLPAPLAARLMRTGFIKIDAAGLFAGNRYVAADKVGGVSNDTVTLTIRKDELAEED
jgi:hypothetical protein